ncbi:MAG: hypothetical protein GXN92_00845 [Candidatus Micrarchaeota archaeon]|nr:hypothetical protein [Candidatus Micrarchaeota archaeon]
MIDPKKFIEKIKHEISLMKRVWLRAKKPDPLEVERLTRVTYLLILVVGGLGLITSVVGSVIDYIAQVIKQ